MNIVSRLKEKITEYIDVQLRLFRITFIGSTANILSYFIFLLIGLFIFFCILLFLGFGLTEVFIAAGLNKIASFFTTIGIYILLLGLLVLLRDPVTRFFASRVITVLTAGDEDDDQPDDDGDNENND